MKRWRRFLALPRRLWGSSLPLRVLSATLLASVLILALSGWVLVVQSSQGIYQTKKDLCLSEASSVLDTMQRQLRFVDTRTATVTDTLTLLAREAATRGSVGGQFHIVVSGPVSDIVSTGIDPLSIPEALRTALATSDDLLSTPANLRFTDGRADEPGIVVAAVVRGPNNVRYPVYLLFPLVQEQETLVVVQRAAAIAGVLMTLSLAAMAYIIARQVVRPVRAARKVAQRMAGGDLDVRMRVKGTDDLAGLATSLNEMAGELGSKIAQLEALSALQQRFVSDVSHELRTPLTTVRMAADVLQARQAALEPDMGRSVELMQTELGRFEELLAELLEISRFDAGAADLASEETDVVALVNAEVEACQPIAQKVGADLVVLGPDRALAEVDARRFRRIVRNLVTNALDYSEGRPVEIWVRADDKAIAVAVRDHGVGFSAEVTGQVFSRFWRADPARGRQVGGTGLGLSISLEDARLHGGWLDAWGTPGGGAQFRLTLPRRQGEPLTGSPWPLVPPDAEGAS